MVVVNRRSFYRGGQDIGAWYGIFSTVTTIGLLNNVAMVCFASTLLTTTGWSDSLLQTIVIFFGVEHLLFFFQFVIADFIPDKAETTNDAIDRLKRTKGTVSRRAVNDSLKRTKLRLANRERFELLNELITDSLEDVQVGKWRTAKINSDQLDAADEVYTLSRETDATADYPNKMSVYADSGWMAPNR